MSDSRTFWLVVTNVILGLAVALCVLGLAFGLLCELVEKIRKRRTYKKELDRDMKAYFGPSRPRK